MEITDEELDAFTGAVKARVGLDFTNYEKKSLKRGLVRLMAKNECLSIKDLWVKMLRDKDMIAKYVDEILVNLTEFFRNVELWQKLRDDVLPKLNSCSKLTCWHAGCSTGEEIYSMAIVLKETFLLYKTQALATDLSAKALAKAIEGSYNNFLLPKYTAAYASYNPGGSVDKYLIKEANHFEIIPQLKKHILFQRHNLVTDEMDKKFKIIFCRNVMIYFDDVLKMNILKMFYNCLEDDGYFIIGYYDMLPNEAKSLFKLYCPITRIYTKNI